MVFKMVNERPRALMKKGKFFLHKLNTVILPYIPVPADIFP